MDIKRARRLGTTKLNKISSRNVTIKTINLYIHCFMTVLSTASLA